MSWRRLIGDAGDQPGEGEKRFNSVKYETPDSKASRRRPLGAKMIFGMCALRYTGEFSGFKLAAGIGYLEITDGPETKTECNARGLGVPQDEKCAQFGGSVSILHEATGLFVSVGAGQKTDDVIGTTPLYAGVAGVDDKQAFWAIQAGIEKKFIDLGKTTIYGEYYDYNGAPIARRLNDGDAFEAIAGLGATACRIRHGCAGLGRWHRPGHR